METKNIWQNELNIIIINIEYGMKNFYLILIDCGGGHKIYSIDIVLIFIIIFNRLYPFEIICNRPRMTVVRVKQFDL